MSSFMAGLFPSFMIDFQSTSRRASKTSSNGSATTSDESTRSRTDSPSLPNNSPTTTRCSLYEGCILILTRFPAKRW